MRPAVKALAQAIRPGENFPYVFKAALRAARPGRIRRPFAPCRCAHGATRQRPGRQQPDTPKPRDPVSGEAGAERTWRTDNYGAASPCSFADRSLLIARAKRRSRTTTKTTDAPRHPTTATDVSVISTAETRSTRSTAMTASAEDVNRMMRPVRRGSAKGAPRNVTGRSPRAARRRIATAIPPPHRAMAPRPTPVTRFGTSMSGRLGRPLVVVVIRSAAKSGQLRACPPPCCTGKPPAGRASGPTTRG
jgi:hypothetical protein